MAASEWGHIETVQALLAQGADVNAKNQDGHTALTYATEERLEDIIRLLKKSGAKE